MAFQIGDIVKTSLGFGGNSYLWVVNGFHDSDAQLVRTYGTGYSRYTKDVDRLIPIERPVFQSGDRVAIDGINGVFMSRERDSGFARIMLAPQRWAVGAHEIMEVGPAVARVSYVTLILQNSKRLKEN